MSSQEFLANSEFSTEGETDDPNERTSREFLRLRLHYDPYSATADEDYDTLHAELARFDVLGMLGREMRKTRVHQGLTRKLITSLRLLTSSKRDYAILTLIENISVLYPVFPTIMMLLKNCIDEIAEPIRGTILSELRQLLLANSYIVQVPSHLAYVIRILAHDRSEESDEILSSIYERSQSSAVRRDIILSMARKNADFWVSDVRKRFATLTDWERTALIVASFTLVDEGDHWRKSVKGMLSPLQSLVRDWADERAQQGKEIPI